MTRYILAAVALTLVYALALASADGWDLGMGAALSLCILFVFRRFLFVYPAVPTVDVLRRLAHLPKLALATGRSIVRGTIDVARAVLSPNLPANDGFVVISDGDRTPSGVVMSGFLDTLSPGSVLINIDPASRTWTIHALDVTGEPDVESNAQHFYEHYQRPVWP